VGGTGLALQIGHRKSNDIVLFTINGFDKLLLLEKLESEFNFSMDYLENNKIKGFIDGVKVDFLSHKYPMINPVCEIEDVRIASLQDISAMKVNAIANDGTQVKDFIDLYFLLQEYSIGQLLDNYQAKYKLRNALHALKSLNYFNEANISAWPEIIKEKKVTWEKVTGVIDSACRLYFNTILHEKQW